MKKRIFASILGIFLLTLCISPVMVAANPEYGVRGKPGVYVTITNPSNGDIVSGIIGISIDSNDNPTISIDGANVGSGLYYDWDTTMYSDGSHTIQASARGHTDIVTVTVSNGGGSSNTQPIVTITNPTNGATVSDIVTITVDATDSEDGSLLADIFIDGTYITTANSYNWDTTTYSDGTHTIYAEATDSGNLMDSDEISVTVNNGGGSTGGDGIVRKWALVIGISDYEGTANDLTYCDDDAQDWINYLQSEGYSITSLIDHQATYSNILAALEDIAANEDADDIVTITYSGHGYYDRQLRESGWVSHDLYLVEESSVDPITDTFESTSIYWFNDCCNIGTYENLANEGWVMAQGSTERTYTYDGTPEQQNGVFTYYAMEAIAMGYFTAEDISNYAISHFNSDTGGKAYLVDNYSGELDL